MTENNGRAYSAVSKTRYLEETGFTDGQLTGWIKRHLTKGVHFQTFGRTTVIFTEEMERWLKQGGPQGLDSEAQAAYR